ncbi:MAG: hypothetical protein WBL05_05085 [Brooklawnia sp.]|uniref:hypothetical protein n=1 Tax=Brooklawnia sp. TaxID=2699740 RepID=UPI003C75A732
MELSSNHQPINGSQHAHHRDPDRHGLASPCRTLLLLSLLLLSVASDPVATSAGIAQDIFGGLPKRQLTHFS